MSFLKGYKKFQRWLFIALCTSEVWRRKQGQSLMTTGSCWVQGWRQDEELPGTGFPY